MQFITKLVALTLAAAAAVSATNTVTFVNQDSTSRKIVFTPSAGNQQVASVQVAGMGSQKVTIPQGWIGNWFSVSQGASNTKGMLGEVTFQGWDGITYFDVSAIVDASDTNGVQEIFPLSEKNTNTKAKFSGCAQGFPCNTAYYNWNDVQTVTTTETDLVCTLGGSGSTGKRAEPQLVARKYVLGQF